MYAKFPKIIHFVDYQVDVAKRHYTKCPYLGTIWRTIVKFDYYYDIPAYREKDFVDNQRYPCLHALNGLILFHVPSLNVQLMSFLYPLHYVKLSQI